jgi:phosphatidylserine/phosphatidylglycerophosphate/cardiolipin synthase-like enzyme
MRYRRVLLLCELGSDPVPALAAARGLAPRAESLDILCSPAARRRAQGPRAGTPDRGLDAWLATMRQAASSVAARSEVGIVADLSDGTLEETVAAADIDLVIAGPAPLGAIPVLAEVRKRHPVAVLWLPTDAAARDRPFTELFCVALGSRAEASIAAFVRDHGDPVLQVTVLLLGRPPARELASALEVFGVRASVALVPPGVSPWRALHLGRERADLVVMPRLVGILLRSARGPAPILVLPPLVPARALLRRPLDVPDLVDDGGVVRVRVGHAFGVGRNPPIPDQEIAFVSSGRIAGVVTTHGGAAELPAGLRADSLGVYRVRDAASVDPIAAIERRVAIVRPGPLPLVLFDADLPAPELSALAAAPGAELLAVRLRAVRSCHLLRERLRDSGLPPRVIDASTLLDEGDASDIGEDLDAVRLARVATRMRAAGFRVTAIVHRGLRAPAALGFEVLRAHEVHGRSWGPSVATPRWGSLAARLEATTGAAPIGGNHVELEVDNATARRWVLEAIEGARRRVHLQTYMAADDDVGRRVEAALREAASRGVEVRVLADSLHGLHGSLRMRNPLLERLSGHAGVEVRVSRPVVGAPSLEDLKQRDHRKVVVADGRLALLGGRNVALEYYTAPSEVRVTPLTTWRAVPWVDAGARVEGPIVTALERSFLEAWTGAGGAPFETVESPPAGSTVARAVVHHGLCDAATLEAYLAIVECARSHVYVLHGFPLLLELQHALVRAVRRGVRVRAAFGHVSPIHGSEPFEGEWAAARALATWFVHSRMDALVAAGGEGYQVAVRDVPGWDPDLGPVYPHVHAKAMSADGRVCAVGSANMDVTGCYWENELLLVVEDPAVAHSFEARMDELIAGSVQVNRDDPDWQRLARRREWLRHWPGVLSA